MERHFKVGDRSLVFEELVEKSRQSPRRIVEMAGGQLTFTEQGEFTQNLSKKRNYDVSSNFCMYRVSELS